jgi:membrane protease YdiL (CAAX protease family)
MQNFNTTDYRTVIINTCFSIFLIGLIICLKRLKYYGFKKVKNKKEYLYFIPLILLVFANLFNGININNTTEEIIYHILTMINIGFIEEIIFRGFLFKMMEKEDLKIAIIVNTITFGIGHIINLFNGADLIPTLIQVVYAMCGGYMFVMLFYKSKSIIPCIITHSLINALSIFNIENEFSIYIIPIYLIIVSLFYGIYISKKVEVNKEVEE